MENVKKTDRKIILIAVIAVVAAVAVILILLLTRNNLSATSMRLMGYEGTVSLSDESGNDITPEENLRLFSGNVLSTGVSSRGYVSLDDTKLVTLGESSIASFIREKKNLTMHLETGGLFFNVTKKLDSDENFDITTSTMTIGIRGTSGGVYTGAYGNTVYLLDGDVHITAIHPESGKTEEIDLSGGNCLTVRFNDDGTIETQYYELSPTDLPSLVSDELFSNDELMERVLSVCDWDEEVVADLQILGKKSIAIEATVVDGIEHASYYTYEDYPEWVDELLTGTIKACEADDWEKAAALSAEYIDKALELELTTNLYFDGYKIYYSKGINVNDEVTKDLYIIPENDGMGYYLGLQADKLLKYSYCPCTGGMYNGDSVMYFLNPESVTYMHITNGLYDGEELMIGEGYRETRYFEYGKDPEDPDHIDGWYIFGGWRVSGKESSVSEDAVKVYFF